jgi:hypothetical protein
MPTIKVPAATDAPSSSTISPTNAALEERRTETPNFTPPS